MRDLQHSHHITEGRAMNMIFDAARDNPNRETRYHWPSGYRVTFKKLVTGSDYEAVVIRKDEMRVAIAIVDEWDI